MTSPRLGFLSSVLLKWQSRSTFLGRSVLPVFLLVRLVMLGAAAQTAWLHDEEEFICNTQHRECTVLCYDRASTVSPVRLWTLQLLLVLAPGLVFLLYLIHVTNQEVQVKEGEVKRHTLGVYLACVIVVILVEIVFVVIQCGLYNFVISTRYTCMSASCPHIVDCFVPHAKGKTVYLLIMFAASCVSVLLSVVEAVCVLRCRKRQEADASDQQSEPSRCFLTQLLALWHSSAGLLGKTLLPVLLLVRFVITGAAIKPVWDNDFRDFYCNTQQPGCSQAAYSILFPFSLDQYWTLQMAAVVAPGLIFLCYLVHLVVRAKQDGAEVVAKSRVLGLYLGILTVVFLLEVGFAVGQVLIFGFILSRNYSSSVSPCPIIVDCVLSQTTEKSLFMSIMLVLTSLSSLLTLVETGLTFRKWRAEKKQQNSCKTSDCHLRAPVRKEEEKTEKNKPIS